MNLTIHRGTNEIGGTCVELSTKNTKILLDFGTPLMNETGGDFNEKILEGQEVSELIKKGTLYPIEGLYNDGTKPRVDAILISHSHKDHYGFLKYANPEIPVYISNGAMSLIDVLNVFIMKEHRVTISNPKTIKDRTPFTIGDFEITPYIVDHSGFEAMSFHVKDKTNKRSIFYSGDFRATGWKRKLFDMFIANPPKGVDYLLLEGTMIDREEGLYPDEPSVRDKMIEILETKDKNIVFAYCSGQNIDRIVAFYKAVRTTGALFVIDAYTACVLNALKSSNSSIPQIDWKDIRVYIANYFGKGDKYVNRINESQLKGFIPCLGRRKIGNRDLSNTKRKVLMLMRNTMIPVVSRISGINGSNLVYSQWDGYIKKDNKDTRKFKDFVSRYNLNVEKVHTSGHATEDKLIKLAKAINPSKKIIPIHTRPKSSQSIQRLFGDKAMSLDNGKPLKI
jgi:ribonuclease J